MMGKEGGGETVGSGEEAVLWGDAGKGFERFLGEGTAALVVGESVHSNEGDGCDGIRTGRRRILKGLAADVEAAHGRGVARTMEAAGYFGIAVAGHGKIHCFLRRGKVTRVEGGFVGVEKRQNAENLIVERAFQSGAADAMAETAGFAPDFLQHAVERFQGEVAATCAE